MKRAPFKMLPSRAARLRRDGSLVVAGRASFVWETLLLCRASGVPGVYEVRRGERDAPWHRVELTIEEAEQELTEWGTFAHRRVARARRTRAAREKRGLEVA